MRFTWRQKLGVEGCPYLIRWVLETKSGSIRLHHWLSSDDERARHDHSWSFITVVLKGGYTDVTDAGEEHLGWGSVRYRKAHHAHTVRVDPGGCWTLLITGPVVRLWGFHVKRADGSFKWLRARRYFFKHGHHPCSSP